MTIGRCEGFAGKDGSTCLHQYCLWSKGFVSLFNFLPKSDTFQRKRFAEIAIGKCLESSFYEPLHLKNMEHMKRKLVQLIQTKFKETMNWIAKPMN